VGCQRRTHGALSAVAHHAAGLAALELLERVVAGLTLEVTEYVLVALLVGLLFLLSLFLGT
jgi:hypothetical protein